MSVFPTRKTRPVLLRGVLCAAVMAAGTLPAKDIEPPLELLHAPANVLAAASVDAVVPPDRVKLTLRKVLHGKAGAGEQLTLRATTALLPELAPGAAVIVGYTALHKDPRQPGELVPDPDGPQLLSSVGLEPALFADIPSTRVLLADAASERGRESRRTYARLLDLLGGSDASLQHLAAAQLVMERETAARLDDSARQRLGAVANDAHAHAAARRLILDAMARDPQHFGDGWAALAGRLATELPVSGCTDATDARPALAQSALQLLERTPTPASAATLARWTRGDCPALAELALLQLRRQQPEAESAAIDAALAQADLPATMRDFLVDHRRRLAVMHQALRRKDAPTH